MEKDTAMPVAPQEETLAPDAPQEESSNIPKENVPTPDAPKRELPLIPILAVLLAVIGIAELVFWSIAGFRVFLNRQEQRIWEEQQAALSQRKDGEVGFSGAAGASQSKLPVPAGPDEKRLSNLSVSWIPYALAEPDVSAAGADQRPQLAIPQIRYPLAEQDWAEEN